MSSLTIGKCFWFHLQVENIKHDNPPLFSYIMKLEWLWFIAYLTGSNLLMKTHFVLCNNPWYLMYNLNMFMARLNLMHHVWARHTSILSETFTMTYRSSQQVLAYTHIILPMHIRRTVANILHRSFLSYSSPRVSLPATIQSPRLASPFPPHIGDLWWSCRSNNQVCEDIQPYSAYAGLSRQRCCPRARCGVDQWSGIDDYCWWDGTVGVTQKNDNIFARAFRGSRDSRLGH